MLHWLTENGALHCLHPGAGKVDVASGSHFVRVNGARVNIKPNPLSRPINGCMHPASTNSKPCSLTLTVNTGYSAFIYIGGKPICLESITGVTESIPPSMYKVSYPGQSMVKST
jgi:hypothetical protein